MESPQYEVQQYEYACVLYLLLFYLMCGGLAGEMATEREKERGT